MNDDTVLVTSSAHFDLLVAQLKGCQEEKTRLREALKGVASYEHSDDDTSHCLRVAIDIAKRALSGEVSK